MANVNCPLCKGAVWIPAKKAEKISPDELVGVIEEVIDKWIAFGGTARDMIAAAILEKYEVRLK